MQQPSKTVDVRTAERYIRLFDGIPSHINHRTQILYDKNYYQIATITNCKPEDMKHLIEIMNNTSIKRSKQ